MKTLISIFVFASSCFLLAQPNTEVYLFDISYDQKGLPKGVKNPINISQNEGYDNQPAFWPDGKSILYSRTIKGQTEIARYFIDSKKTEIITRTLQGSEYSPTPTPNGKISSVRLDTTGLQLLYAYDLDGNDEILIKDLVVGYHAWVSEDEIITFVLGDTITMQLVNVITNQNKIIGTNIGRSLHKIPNSNQFSYLDKSAEKWVIRARDAQNGMVESLTTPIQGSEDYCWTVNNEIIMSKENTLWIWRKGMEWKLFADLSNFGISGVTRLQFSPSGEKLVLVVNQ
ncbi:MAG: hypothetical protein AAF789_09530 [Bacteroidota bacterium]